MATADALILGAGAVSFFGNMKERGGFPSNAFPIIGGTIGLAVLSSFTNGTLIYPAVKALAALILLVAIIRYIPGLTNTRKAPHHG